MKYLDKSFSVPAAGPKVTQEDWDRIFGKLVEDAVAAAAETARRLEDRKREAACASE